MCSITFIKAGRRGGCRSGGCMKRSGGAELFTKAVPTDGPDPRGVLKWAFVSAEATE